MVERTPHGSLLPAISIYLLLPIAHLINSTHPLYTFVTVFIT